MVTCNGLSKNDPVCGNFRYLSLYLNLEIEKNVDKIVVFWSKSHFSPKILIFTFLAKLILLNIIVE